MSSWLSPLRLPMVIVASLTIAGCEQPSAPCTVTGEVHVKGKPTEGVYIVLFPADGDTSMSAGSARTSGDGTYSIKVPRTGTYSVTAFYPATELDEGAVVEGPDQFAGRYRNREKPVTTIDIVEGDNVLEPLKLK
ncbi:hypothetical protein [Aeoliella sp. SH292]|uniref:hypothetical protein n=1 Tax=Aeoliella sp. SH292 TaxID=3454464 RepID=UPI003F9D7661